MAQSNEPSIIEMNRIICEFMGWEFKKDPKFEHMAYFEGRQMWCDNLQGVNKVLLEGFKYHEDWNKLMPVVEKIESIENKRFGVCIDVLDTMIMDYKVGYDQGEKIVIQTDIYPDNGDTKISITHAAVYQFIQWYNQQKQNNEQ